MSVDSATSIATFSLACNALHLLPERAPRNKHNSTKRKRTLRPITMFTSEDHNAQNLQTESHKLRGTHSLVHYHNV